MNRIILEDMVSSIKMAHINKDGLEHIIIDIKENSSKVNNIYRGRINKIIKNINSCFVDIGGNTGYLKMDKENFIEGDTILVQVKKDPIGDKKMKLSQEVGIRGRYMVYIPSETMDLHINISKKITDKNEKKRLRDVIRKINLSDRINATIVLRTESQNVDEDKIINEYYELKKTYESIYSEFRQSFSPKLLYRGDNSILEYIEKNIEDVDEILVVEGEFSNQIKEHIKKIDRSKLLKIKTYEVCDLFEDYGVNHLLNKLKTRIIRLASGGSIVIDRTEAMTVIDVNTGSNKNIQSLEKTIYQTNYEAGIEISNQIIRRDISGIIVIDFIDMNEDDSEKIRKHIIRCFKEDSSRTRVYDFTKLGLLEISRMRKGYSIDNYFKSTEYILDNIEREVIRNIVHHGNYEVLLTNKEYKDLDFRISDKLRKIEEKYGIKLYF